MPRYTTYVLPDNLSRGTNAVKLLFVVLKDKIDENERILLIGVTPDHSDLFYDFWTTYKKDRNSFEGFALGRRENGVAIFEPDTPDWKQAEILPVLAGEGCKVHVERANQERRNTELLREMADRPIQWPNPARQMLPEARSFSYVVAQALKVTDNK